MPHLFEPITIGNLTLPNRFVRSATWEGLAAENGACTPRLVAMMEELVRGEAGLIISGHAYVSRAGQAGPWQLGVYADDLLPGLTDMAAAVHSAGGKIVLQLAHGGNQASARLTGLPPRGPSAMQIPGAGPCLPMTPADIQGTVTTFSAAASRARQAGFDGVQLHAAHGYLLSQFLSPYFNHRSDAYGGPVANRARLLLEVCGAIREAVGESFPLLVKLNSEDFLEPGLTQDEMLEVAAALEKAGVDAVELSGGTGFSGAFHPIRRGILKRPEDEAFYKAAARRFKERMGIPLMLVGGIRSFEVAGQLIGDEIADCVSLCRPLICEPHLVRRWRAGDLRPSPCLSDNLCLKATRAGEGLYCVVEREAREKA